MSQDAFKKNRLSLRSWLEGRGYFDALRAMDFAEKHHTGMRKDGKTPEFAHQIRICQFLRTLEPHLENPQAVLCAAMLHDVAEDYGISRQEIRAVLRDPALGAEVDASVYCLTKVFRGIKRDPDEVMTAISKDRNASIVKGADRVDNQGSMVGVFSLEKQAEYIGETRNFILPMLKQARGFHPEQAQAYENIKMMIRSQVELVEAMHDVHLALSPEIEEPAGPDMASP